MASNNSSSEEEKGGGGREGREKEEDSHNNGGTKRKRIKQRHKFAKEELQELHMIVKQKPYPDYTMREELATKFHCEVHVIKNWFQNYRARLLPEEKHRISVCWKKQNCLTQAHQRLSTLGTQVVASNNATEHGFFNTQKVPIKTAGWTALDQQGTTSQQMGSNGYSVWNEGLPRPQACYGYPSVKEQQVPNQQMYFGFYSVQKQGLHSPNVYASLPPLEKQEVPGQEVCSPVAGSGKQAGRELEYPDDTGSGHFPAYYLSYSSAGCIFPSTSGQHFDSDRPKARKPQHGSPFLGYQARQQEEQEEDHRPASQDQPQNQQHPWQQSYNDGEQIVFCQQLTMDQSQRDLGQQLPLFQLQSRFPETSRMSWSSQLQPEPLQMADGSASLPLGQYTQQGTLAQPMAQIQQLYDENPVSIHFPDRGTQPQEAVLYRSVQSRPHHSSSR